ncbi:MAG: hypothetical protein KY433_05590 [Actinobacteria bacterium]|nr:hypothetical protein [Actinomycetota bacterium]
MSHVLVTRLDNDGDVLLAGPAIRAVAAGASRVTLLCGPRGRAAAQLLPGVDAVVVRRADWIDPEPGSFDRTAGETWVADLEAIGADRAVILGSFHQSPLPLALLLRMAGVPHVAATSVDYPGSLLDVRHTIDDDVHEVERSLDLVRTLGFTLPPGDDGALDVQYTGGAPTTLDGAPYVVVHPGASVPARAWAPERNAALALDQERLKDERRRQQRVEALDGLQEALGLDSLPLRIECFDISNLMGTNTTASMVVFEGGAPKKSDYRRFNVRSTTEGVPDDFAAMQEVLARRLARWESEQDLSPNDSRRNESFATLPSLIVIDGGPGQLSAGVRALQGFRDRGVAVVSLAKQLEEVFLPGRRAPLRLAHDTPALQLLQRLRDEAHRFAVTHHRQRRDRQMTESVLDGLPGVGPKRKRALLKHFGSPEAMLGASREELEAVPGLPSKTARDLYSYLNRTSG